jgi:hypothetical protein
MANELPPRRLESDIPASNADKVTGGLGEIVVFVDGCNESAGILEFAGAMAHQYGAHLIGVFMQPDVPSSTPEMFARGTGMWDVIEEHQAQLESIEADYRARFEDIVRRHGIRSEWRSSPHFTSDVGVHAHYADLAVIARPDPAGRAAGPPDLRSADHYIPATRHGIPGSPRPSGVERWAGSNPGHGGRSAIPCAGRSGRGPDC